MEPKALLEAVLFASYEGLRAVDLSKSTGLSESQVQEAIKSLQDDYEGRGSALRVLRAGGRYSLCLREEYLPYGQQFSPPEIPPSTLRTAAMIAYHQPVEQSELCRSLGARVYDDVRKLRDMGLVDARKKGQTLELSTNRRFSEHFGIDARRREDVRRWMDSAREVQD